MSDSSSTHKKIKIANTAIILIIPNVTSLASLNLNFEIIASLLLSMLVVMDILNMTNLNIYVLGWQCMTLQCLERGQIQNSVLTSVRVVYQF